MTIEHAFPSERRFGPILAGLIVAAALLYVVASMGFITNWAFPDPDDQMRLLEVRDLLAGQAWTDVSQHRMNAPWGVAMHWSRLVDLPLAGVMLLLRPLLGAAQAEAAAVIAVPLMTLATSMALAALLARALQGRGFGLVAAALMPLTVGALQQMRPLRIDHHGWQVAIALGIALALAGPPTRRRGLAAGALAGLWLTISLEGLPLCAATGALVALGWLLDPARHRDRFEGFAGGLALAALALFATTRPAGAWTEVVCDAVSPVHLAVLAVAGLGALVAVRVACTLPARAIALGLIGAACAVCYVGAAPGCVDGAFGALDPLVYKFWYNNVLEGLPVWRLSLGLAVTAIGFPLLALGGAAIGIARREGAARRTWVDYVLLLVAATLVTLFVQRAGAVANALALPAGLELMRVAVARAQRLRASLPRVLGTAGAICALLPTTPAMTAAGFATHAPRKAHTPVTSGSTCATTANYATAAQLPAATLFTNIDIGPGILFTTPHRVIASGHHRNRMGMHDVIAAFLGDDATAHRLILRHRAAYVVVCADLVEMDLYRDAAPHGFWAGLARGRTPAWLRPVRLPGSSLSVWRVIA